MNYSNLLSLAVLGASSLALAGSASAQERAPAVPQVAANTPAGSFGGKGQLAISSDAGLSIDHTSVSGGGTTTTFVLRPAIDYFVIDNLSVGGFLGFDYSKAGNGSATVFSVGPRVGYNIPFSPLFSVWPKAGFSFASTSTKTDAIGPVSSTSTSNTAFQANIFVPIMLHPAEHFFVGFGPALDADLSGDNKATTIGGRLTLGGWL